MGSWRRSAFVETRQEVVSAGEEKVARCEFLCIFGRRCGRGQGQDSLNAIARNLGARRNLKHRNLWNVVPEHYHQA